MNSLKEHRLNQHAKVIWLTGVSGAGKTVLAKEIHEKLFSKGYFPVMLDGDDMRKGLCSNLDFTVTDRMENARRVAETAKILIDNGIISICSLISPTKEIRKLAKKIIGAENYIEVFVNTPFNDCEKRDTKGLYEKARRGFISYFTGISSPYEKPNNPDIEINTNQFSIDQCVNHILEFTLPKIEYKYE